jgi:hypothetical protein
MYWQKKTHTHTSKYVKYLNIVVDFFEKFIWFRDAHKARGNIKEMSI